ncbi:MAG: tyrosine-type recombinase/integrase [Verrucomicrobiales bacterium]
MNVPATLSDNGTRKREYFGSKRHALARIRELERNQDREGSRADLAAILEPYGATLWDAVNFFVDVQDRFRPMLQDYGTTVSEAVEFFLSAQQQKARSCEFCRAFAEFMEAKSDRRERTKADYRHVANHVGKHLKGEMLIDLNPRRVDDVLKKTCRTPYGRRRFMAVLKAFFNWAIRREYLEKNPVIKLDPVELSPTRKPILSNDEVRRLLANCRDDMRAYYLLGLFCGIRPKELQSLEWCHVDFEQKHIYIPGSISKTWDHRYVYMSNNLVKWLDKEVAQNRHGSIIPHNFFEKHRECYEAAGIAWKQDVMRHTFASNHLAHHNDLDLLLRQMGHRSSPQTLWRHYHHARTLAEAEEFWEI